MLFVRVGVCVECKLPVWEPDEWYNDDVPQTFACSAGGKGAKCKRREVERFKKPAEGKNIPGGVSPTP